MANGFTRDAELETVLLIRGDINKPQLASLNINAILGQADMSQNINLQPGDVLYVPTTKIASVDRYFRHLYSVILPIVTRNLLRMRWLHSIPLCSATLTANTFVIQLTELIISKQRALNTRSVLRIIITLEVPM